MQGVKDASHLYEVERRARHAERPGFRINELTISPTQKVPWHYHTNVGDTFYVLEGSIRIFMRDPKEDVTLTPKTIIFLKGTTTLDKALETLQDAFKSLNALIDKQGITRAGPAMAIYSYPDDPDDLNFAYHPSCRYDPRWVCPLAPRDNVIDLPIRAGERMTQP